MLLLTLIALLALATMLAALATAWVDRERTRRALQAVGQDLLEGVRKEFKELREDLAADGIHMERVFDSVKAILERHGRPALSLEQRRAQMVADERGRRHLEAEAYLVTRKTDKPVTVKELRKRLRTRYSNAVETLKWLEGKGLVPAQQRQGV